ncbi:MULTISPECIES: ribosomal-processing cysteine protease Prp [Clostridium]|uniref:Ribosomal processing cysteine protease Prp n=1 Tax=Clostridium cibarium TaxID=2762247 RepID=A0ABR8PR33_9CLOT|nr:MULTISPECIES: ribosomal-processing cysteine protease Prp [Clostridium]MBD7910627.1 ribosomal-processing cysteine protease Prp [Clostridium cibarium]
MIEIKIRSRKDNILSFSINSHALRDREAILAGDAYDMICNTVSVLSQSVIIGLDEVLKLNVNYEMKDGYLALDLQGFTDEETNEAQVLLKTFEKSLDSTIMSLDQSFGEKKRKEYIILKHEEV